MNDFCDLLGTPYPPVSKIAPVKENEVEESQISPYHQFQIGHFFI
jgi:hypothetical protein